MNNKKRKHWWDEKCCFCKGLREHTKNSNKLMNDRIRVENRVKDQLEQLEELKKQNELTREVWEE